jgi:hypothetical protein
MTEDPSAWGVAAAFIGDEDEMEEAFVKWCEIVGKFFVREGDDRRLRRRSTGDAEDVARSRSKSKSAGTMSFTRSWSRVLARKRMSVTEKEMEAQKRKPVVRDLAILPTNG